MWLIGISLSPPSMRKRKGDSSTGTKVKVKKLRGVKIRSIAVPDSDDEDQSRKDSPEYARLVKTRVSTLRKADSVTMSSLQLTEDGAPNDDSAPITDDLGPAVNDNDEATVENVEVPVTTARKERKKANDSVGSLCYVLSNRSFQLTTL